MAWRWPASWRCGRGGKSGGARLRSAALPAGDPAVGGGEAIAGSGIALGGQDCHSAPKGAHTGDISAEMLADAGCSYVILGHSERRQDHGETDARSAPRSPRRARAGLNPILCVGETRAQREAGTPLRWFRRSSRVRSRTEFARS